MLRFASHVIEFQFSDALKAGNFLAGSTTVNFSIRPSPVDLI
jgi:hypothetical protein